MKYAMVNVVPMELGCYSEGSRGQYGIDRLAEVAFQAGLGEQWSEMVAAVRLVDDQFSGWIEAGEILGSLDEEIVGALNDATEDGFRWSWEDGELFLMEEDDDDDIQ